MRYEDFIASKKAGTTKTGFKIPDSHFNKNLFDYQREILDRSCEVGKYALFMDTGLGKSITQLNYAEAVYKHTNRDVLILAPLAVVYQLLKEAVKFGFDLNHARSQSDIKRGLNITNYDSVGKFDADHFAAIIMDESSILKNVDGKTRKYLTAAFSHTPFKLLATATPSPNDFTELGTHSQFLNGLSVMEMKMMYFTQDRGSTQDYILKGHAEAAFWEWVSSWAECITSPADLGYDGSRHILPNLNEVYHEIVHDDTEYLANGSLFSFNETNATTIGRNKRATIEKRAELAGNLIGDEQHLLWIETNHEADVLKASIDDVYEVRGSDSDDKKAELLNAFADGEIKRLITKPSIAGMGMNFQGAHNMTFIGLSYSYEKYYQAVRRMYRFGQKHEVNVNVIVADNERTILDSIHRKKEQHDRMKKSMTRAIVASKKGADIKMNVNKKFNFPNFLQSKGV